MLSVWHPRNQNNPSPDLTSLPHLYGTFAIKYIEYWRQRRIDWRLGNPPQGNQKPLLVKDGELVVACLTNVIPTVSLLWRCCLSDTNGIWHVKIWVLVCWCWWFDWSLAHHSSSCHHHFHHPRSYKIQNCYILVPACLRCPGKCPLNVHYRCSCRKVPWHEQDGWQQYPVAWQRFGLADQTDEQYEPTHSAVPAPSWSTSNHWLWHVNVDHTLEWLCHASQCSV